jgi:hypothetical protein
MMVASTNDYQIAGETELAGDSLSGSLSFAYLPHSLLSCWFLQRSPGKQGISLSPDPVPVLFQYHGLILIEAWAFSH